ncbi:hypothetical protein AALM99_11670 [Lactococcus muris]|uniref:Phage protein n=1 Tax=Lactococcus muris TaxID=2941330 RepID=A0ABV4DC79_9LACT|nr:hypothetical protein [Lactococcus garvieae]
MSYLNIHISNNLNDGDIIIRISQTKELEEGERDGVFEFEQSDDFKDKLRDNLDVNIGKDVMIIWGDKD